MCQAADRIDMLEMGEIVKDCARTLQVEEPLCCSI
jgi:hypothetical protein